MPRSSLQLPLFNPEKLPFETTLARQIAKQHLSRLNNVYWVGERAHHLIRTSLSSIIMPAPGPGVHGCFGSENAWQDAVDQFRIWRRQHVLISAASLLEVYIKSASIAAFSAKPDIVDRSFSGHDAFSHIRFPERVPKYLRALIDDRSQSFTNGSWKERLRRMSILFGKLPDSLVRLESNLQSMQTTRNKVAHSYGMNGELRRTPWEEVKVIDVPPAKIEGITKTVSNAISIMDNEVFGPIIGGFEMVHEYSVWLASRTKSGKPTKSQNLENEFRDHLGREFGSTPGRNYLEPMIRYYDALR